jgi:MYXO-CTERM domain-containing protein
MTNPGTGRTTTAFGWLACALGLFRRRRRSDT